MTLIDVDIDPKWPRQTSDSTILPKIYTNGRTPLNYKCQRTDIHVNIPSADEIRRFNTQYKGRLLCHYHHLGQKCKLYRCRHDHGVLKPEACRVLRYKVLSLPCKRGAACLVPNCFYGHICPRNECQGDGGRDKDCRMPDWMHGLGLNFANSVQLDDSSTKGSTAQVARDSAPEQQPLTDLDDLIIWD